MRHLNGNLLCVVDVETTGTDFNQHEIIEICVMPLDNQFRPHAEYPLFQQEMRPDKMENIDFQAIRVMKQQHDFYAANVCFSKERLAETSMRGMDQSRCADLFIEWFENLGLATFKRIMPLAQNWVFDAGFIKKWLGEKSFEYAFDPRYRDTMTASLFANDCAAQVGDLCPYEHNNLTQLCNCLSVERARSHTATDDCIATAEVYKRMIGRII